MDSINRSNVKRVNSLAYVTEGKLIEEFKIFSSYTLKTGPKPDSPLCSPMEQSLQSLTQGTVNRMTGSFQQYRRRSSSDVGTPTDPITSSVTSSIADSGYGKSLEERFIKRSISLQATPSKLSLPDREEHKPDGMLIYVIMFYPLNVIFVM